MRVVIGLCVLGMLFTLTGCPTPSNTFNPLAKGVVTGYVYQDPQRTQLLVAPETRDGMDAVNGATVSVRGLTTLVTTTDADGSFTLPDVPVGARVIDIACPGYSRGQVAVTVSEGENPISYTGSGQTAISQWTVLIYMAGDNSLDGEAVRDMKELETVGSSNEVKMVVLMDRLGSGGSNIYEVRKDPNPQPNQMYSPVVQPMGEIDTGNKDTLRNFITWGQEQYPAEHYLVVLWNHGSGWDPDTRMVARSIAEDVTSKSIIQVTDLPYALTGKYPIDIIAADACYMAMLEVAYEIRGCADFYVAAEELEPSEGYAYQRIMTLLQSPQGLAMTPRQFADEMAKDALVEWGKYGDTTCSAIDLARVHGVVAALDRFAERLVDAGQFQQAGLLAARKDLVVFGGDTLDLRTDLYDYVSLVQANVTDSQMRQRADEVKAAVDQAVVANYVAAYRPRAHGISIYCPTRDIYFATRTSTKQPAPSVSYPLLALNRDSRWNEWLASQP